MALTLVRACLSHLPTTRALTPGKSSFTIAASFSLVESLLRALTKVRATPLQRLSAPQRHRIRPRWPGGGTPPP